MDQSTYGSKWIPLKIRKSIKKWTSKVYLKNKIYVSIATKYRLCKNAFSIHKDIHQHKTIRKCFLLRSSSEKFWKQRVLKGS